MILLISIAYFFFIPHAVVQPCSLSVEQQDDNELNENAIELLQHLQNCGYDKLRPPSAPPNQPLKVYLKLYFYYLKSYEAHDLQFTVYMLMQSRFKDSRLQFNPDLHNISVLVGTQSLIDQIWTPHLFVRNDKVSHIMGDGRDVMIHISHDGTVLYTKRIMTTLFCWMKLHKFPFDFQECSLQLESWAYNMSNLELFWEENGPILCRDELSLTEFRVVGKPTSSKIVTNVTIDWDLSDDPHAGVHSLLLVTFGLKRESGFYIYDYFVPSILLVVVSWVSFWLEADAIPARVALGTSTMLTFIILALQTGNSVAKVSYIKSSEIWFLVCSAFIFGSLVEFAFVNTIFRSRRSEIHLKKLNSKYVLRETLTPKEKRRHPLERSHSCPDENHSARHERLDGLMQFKCSLPSVATFEIQETAVSSSSSSKLMRKRQWSPAGNTSNESVACCNRANKKLSTPTKMTPQEIAQWIDSRSQVLFPISFLVFNVFFWLYNYIF